MHLTNTVLCLKAYKSPSPFISNIATYICLWVCVHVGNVADAEHGSRLNVWQCVAF
jgi:hypothetical protein